MTTPNSPDPETPKPVEELLAAPELARAVNDEDFKRFLDHVPVALAVARGQGEGCRIVYANAAFEALTMLAATEIVGKSWETLAAFTHEDHPGVPLSKAAGEGEDFLGHFRREGAEGATILVQAYAAVIENEDGAEDYRVVALVDVSHQERTDREAYESQIRDNDVLLKELQHRVRNNLQLVTALIRLEIRSLRRGAPVDLERLAGRIEALSLLYRTLAADAFGPELDLGQYVGQIASASMHAHAVDGFELDLRLGYAPVSINVAMPVGLIVNELLTNAFKHAFAGRAQGKIIVECRHEEGDYYSVAVADDGAGFPAGVSWPSAGKLAALILEALRENTRELSLDVDTAPARGVRTTLAFRHLPPSARKN